MRRIEVATGGSPMTAMAATLLSLGITRGFHQVAIAHDEGCPCERGEGTMSSCTCEIVELILP